MLSLHRSDILLGLRVTGVQKQAMSWSSTFFPLGPTEAKQLPNWSKTLCQIGQNSPPKRRLNKKNVWDLKKQPNIYMCLTWPKQGRDSFLVFQLQNLNQKISNKYRKLLAKWRCQWYPAPFLRDRQGSTKGNMARILHVLPRVYECIPYGHFVKHLKISSSRC